MIRLKVDGKKVEFNGNEMLVPWDDEVYDKLKLYLTKYIEEENINDFEIDIPNDWHLRIPDEGENMTEDMVNIRLNRETKIIRAEDENGIYIYFDTNSDSAKGIMEYIEENYYPTERTEERLSIPHKLVTEAIEKNNEIITPDDELKELSVRLAEEITSGDKTIDEAVKELFGENVGIGRIEREEDGATIHLERQPDEIDLREQIEIALEHERTDEEMNRILDTVNVRGTTREDIEVLRTIPTRGSIRGPQVEARYEIIDEMDEVETMETNEDKIGRIERGLQLFKDHKVKEKRVQIKKYEVEGSGGNIYEVMHDLSTDEWSCDCPDHTINGFVCKHIWSAKMSETPLKENE